MELTSFAPVSSLLWKYLESCKIDPAPIYRRAGIEPKLLSNPEARISNSKMDLVWNEVVELRCERVLQCAGSQSRADRGEVHMIVVVDECVVSNLRIHRERGGYEQQTDRQARSHGGQPSLYFWWRRGTLGQ